MNLMVAGRWIRKYWSWLLAGTLVSVALALRVTGQSLVLSLPNKFVYEVEVNSADNLYDSAAQRYSGQEFSQSTLRYEELSRQGGVAKVKNSFRVTSADGQPIFAAERQHGIDVSTRQHVAGSGDRERSGYLF